MSEVGSRYQSLDLRPFYKQSARSMLFRSCPKPSPDPSLISRMERSKRQPVVSASRRKEMSALEQLKAAREGKSSRVKDFEVKEEAALYDVVSEADYAALAAKRRAEGGAIQISCMARSAVTRFL